MPFAFSEICTLFSRLEDIELHDPPILAAAERNARSQAVTESWFKSHRYTIDQLTATEAVGLLSALLPERRSDRVYGIQSTTLCRILSRCLGLSAARAKDLQAYKRHGGGDLGLCLERVLKSSGPPARPPVHLSEVDDMLNNIASNCRFSGPHMTSLAAPTESTDALVRNITNRLDPTQAKWLVRLILKDLSPIQMNETTVLQSFHFLLPDLLRFQSTFDAAVTLLRGPLREFPPRPDPRSRILHRQSAALQLVPVVGIQVGRPTFVKGRSIDSCIKMCKDRKWIIERKYDGEYCELHIDMTRSSRPSECIKIFSKSGKDSTDDRKELHQTLIDCFRLEHPDRRIKQRAIVLGEIVVYSDTSADILPFEKVRQHVTRSGIFIGTAEDSCPNTGDHLAIVFFDLLLLDNEIIMRKPLEERRRCLREVYTKIQGRAIGAEWKIVDFQDVAKARRMLIQQFAASIAERCEGLILKPCGEPYFHLNQDAFDGTKSYIKLKKDYVAGMGDEADLAVIGGSYDGQQALQCATPHVIWTTFHLGCLLNKPEVVRFGVRGRFKVVATIHAKYCIPRVVLDLVNSLGTLSAKPWNGGSSTADFDIEHVPSEMTTVFGSPMVFEVLGSGFEKPSNSSFLMLRHPRVKKLHQDRSWKDCTSLEELQIQAMAARDPPPEGESHETLRLIEKLEAKCQKRSQSHRSHESSNSRVKKTYHDGSPDGIAPAMSKRRCGLYTSAEMRHRTKRQRIDGPACKSAAHVDRSSTADGFLGPLTDITNTVSRPAHGSELLFRTQPNSKIETWREKDIGFPVASTLLPWCSRFPASHTVQEQQTCADSSCFLTGTVIYVSSCIASTPYIMGDLLPRHNITMATALHHWDRDSFAHPRGTDTISESQAYQGMRKIVLVERMRPHAVNETIKRILEFNGRCWRERVEFWDWRVLESEDCRLHGQIAVCETRRHFLGATSFGLEKDRAVYEAVGGFGTGHGSLLDTVPTKEVIEITPIIS